MRIARIGISPVGSSAQYQMSPEFQILHTVAHMVYHLSKGGLGARHYLDLWLLRSKTAFDEQEVRELCASCGVLKYYEAACDLTAVWLEGQAYTDLTAALEAHCFGGGLFGSEQCIVALGICKNGKAGFLRNRLFPPMHIMAEQYPILRKHSRLLPLYYGKRLCDKLSSRWRRSLKELRLVHKSSGSEVRSLDELLQRLGL